MKLSLSWVRVIATCSLLIPSLVVLPALPASAERPSNGGHLFLWLLGLRMADEQGAPRKIDANSATVEELAALPGMERSQAQRITVNRPYATLQDLARAGLSPRLIQYFAAFITINREAPDPANAKPSRR